jgi:hypothetical protein
MRARKGATMEVDGRIEGIQRYSIHGTLYFRAYFAHDDSPDEIRQAQLPFDAMDIDLQPGDPIRITYLLKTVMEIRKRAK